MDCAAFVERGPDRYKTMTVSSGKGGVGHMFFAFDYARNPGLCGMDRREAKNTRARRIIKRISHALGWSDFASDAYSWTHTMGLHGEQVKS